MDLTALHLESKGDFRALIAYVEHWAEVAKPTVVARLAQARAFLELRMIDRAWSRLKELVDEGEQRLELQVVLGRMFLERGWPNQARIPLERAMAEAPDDARVRELWDRLTEPPTQPDPAVVEEEGARLDDLLHVAESYMAQNVLVKAEALLERIRRVQPDHERATDLLWAMRGDYRLDTDDLADLTGRYAPDLSSTLVDLGEEPEHTESSNSDDLHVPPEQDGRAFPALFRHSEERTTGYHAFTGQDAEVTHVSSMAAIADVPSRRESTSTGEDTQILRVVNRDGAPPARTAAAETAFDLAAFRREHGMHYATGSDLAVAPEGEDDDVIVLTRRSPRESTEPTTDAGGLDLDARAEGIPGHKLPLDEAAEWAKPPSVAAITEVPTPRQPGQRAQASRPEGPPVAHIAGWWLVALVGVVLFGVVAVSSMIGLGLVGSWM